MSMDEILVVDASPKLTVISPVPAWLLTVTEKEIGEVEFGVKIALIVALLAHI